MADLKETIKALEVCREMDNPPGWRTATCEDCPYHGDGCARKLKEDAAELLKYQQAEIENKKHEKRKFLVDETGKMTPLPIVTRCKDCEWRGNKKKCILAFVADKQEFPLFFYDQRGEWFCADGKPKDGDGDDR